MEVGSRETMEGGQIVVQVEDKVVQIRNMKLDGRLNGHADSREKVTEFGFDYCYWSVDPESPKYASQEEVFQDLGVSVLAGASEGYNVCLFAYGQTGSGKTYTMMGTPDSTGLTPRICQGLFGTDSSLAEGQGSCRVEISFLEIYNERVRDLLRCPEQKPNTLRVREHPEKGPYVQGLLQYIVSDYKQAVKLLEMGIGNRMTATTHMHDASSRSHAIFSIQYTQAILENNLPSEIVSKINLVDLAGSERADPNFCRDRITEGSNINKSLVTLGIVISGLAQNSQMFSSCQSINSMASEGEGSTVGSQSSSLSGSTRRQCFIPYRDSVLTWLLKDSLGGNSRTIMIATISPSCSSYNETLSTLRYAAHARNIVNKPRVNEDANVKLIRELREEIDRLKSMLLSFEMQRNSSPSLSDDRDGSFSDIVLQNELKVEQLTKDWSERWHDQKELLEQYSVDIDRDRAGFLIRSLLPHLIALDQDVLNTGVTFYHLREGITKIGPHDLDDEPQIVLQGEARCEIVNQSGVVILKPVSGTVCMVNGREVTEPYRLAQGAIITLGDVQKFRFNHPAEAAILRARRRASEGVLGCFSLDLSHLAPDTRVERDSSWEQGDDGQRAVPWKRVEEQQRYVQCLREEIQVEQQRAELDLEREQAHLRQQHREIQQWVLQEKQRLSADGKRITEEPGVQSDLNLQSHPKGLEFSGPEVEVTDKVVGARKQVVQEELLRHHALRRAESRVRQKRLRYQLQRIARKRLLLEAKRELQRLETALSPEAPSSPEPVFPMKTRAPAHHALRRHSFSADLLSRLYPKHTPIFSHFLRRNKSLELSSSLWRGVGSQKWVSDEFLPSRKMRNRANTLPSGSELRCATRTNSLENLRAAIPHSASTSSGMRERTKSRLIESSQEQRPQTDSLEPPRNGPKKTLLAVSKSNTSHFPPKISKSFSQGSKGLERIRKVFAQSAGPGIRNALSKLFRKPPSRFVAARVTKSINNTAGQFSGNKESERNIQLEVKKTEKSKVKVAFSCENLEQVALSKRVGKRRWHSEEALTKVVLQTKGQPSFPGWLEKTKLEDKEGSSDCDSSYSLDSLSSAYATALTEQLRQADFEQSGDESKSEPESVDSQISKDSLVIEGSSKITVKPKKFKQTLSSLSYTHVKTDSGSTVEKKSVNLSSTGSSASDEMPAEAYWRLHSSPKPKHGGKAESRTEVVNQQVMGSEHRGPESKTSEELADGWSVAGCDPHLFTCAKEPESLHVLTHPWSSTNNTNNPRVCEDPMAAIQQIKSRPKYNGNNLQCRVDLSDRLNSDGNKPICVSDCMDGENITVMQELCNSDNSDHLLVGMLGDEKISTLRNTAIQQDSVSSEISNFQGSSNIESSVMIAVEETLEKKACSIRKQGSEPISSSCGTNLYKHADSPSLICKHHNFPLDCSPVPLQNSETLQVAHSSERWNVDVDNVGLSSTNVHSSYEVMTLQMESTAKKEKGNSLSTEPSTVFPEPVTMVKYDVNTVDDSDEKGTADSMASEQSLFREGKYSLMITDAWSSTETSDSPRTHEGEVGQSSPLCGISCQSSLDFSRSFFRSDSQPFSTSDCTDKENATVMQQESLDSEKSADNSQISGMFEDSYIQKIQNIHPSANVMIKQESVNYNNDFEGCLDPEIVAIKVEDTVILETCEKQRQTEGNKMENSSSDTYQQKFKDVTFLNKTNNFGPDSVLLQIPDTLRFSPSVLECVDHTILSRNSTSDSLCKDVYPSAEAKPIKCGSNAEASKSHEGSQIGGGNMVGFQPLAVSICDRKTLDTDAEKSDAVTILSFSSKQCDKDLLPKLNTLNGLDCCEENLTERSEIVVLNQCNYTNNNTTSENSKEDKILHVCSQKGEKSQGERWRTIQTIHSIQNANECQRLDGLIETKVQNVNVFCVPVNQEKDLNDNQDIDNVVKNTVDKDPHKPEHDLHADKEDARVKIDLEQTYRPEVEVQSSEQDINQSAPSCVPNPSLPYSVYSFKDTRKCNLDAFNTTKENAFFSATLLSDLENEVKNCSSELRPVAWNECKDTPTHNSSENLEQHIFMQTLPRRNVSVSEFRKVNKCQQSHEDFPDFKQATKNPSVVKNYFKSCNSCIPMESVDISLSNYDGTHSINIDQVALHPASVMQRGKSRFFGYCGKDNSGDTTLSSVDQKISEVVQEHLSVNLNEFVETRNNDKREAKTCDLNLHKNKTMSKEKEPISLCGVEKHFFARNQATAPLIVRNSFQTQDVNNVYGHLNMPSVTPTELTDCPVSPVHSHLSEVFEGDFPRGDAASVEKRDLLMRSLPSQFQDQRDLKTVVSHIPKKNAASGNADHSSQEKDLDVLSNEKINYVHIGNIFKEKGINSSITKTEEPQSNEVVVTNKLQSELESNQSNTAKNEEPATNFWQNQKESSDLIADHQTGTELLTERVFNYEAISMAMCMNDVRSAHSSQSHFEGCQCCNLARKGLLNKPEMQTEANCQRSVFTSDEACPIPETKEVERNSLPDAEDSSAVLTQLLYKISPSFSDGAGTDDYLDVCMPSWAGLYKKVLEPNTERPPQIKTLSELVEIAEPAVSSANTGQDFSTNRESEDTNRENNTVCRLDSQHAKLPCEDSLKNMSVEYLSSPDAWPLDSDVLNFHYRDKTEIIPCKELLDKTEFVTQSLAISSEIMKSCSQCSSMDGVNEKYLEEEGYNKNSNSLTLNKDTHSYVMEQTENEFFETNCTKTKSTVETFQERAVNKQASNSEVISEKFLDVVKANAVSSFSYSHDSLVESTGCSLGDKESLKSDYIRHQYTDNAHANFQKEKAKRLKRINAKVTLNSSTESSVYSSPEEKGMCKVHPNRSLLTQCKSVPQKQSRHNKAVRSKKAPDSICSPFHRPLLKDDKSLKHCRETGTQMAVNLYTLKKGNCVNARDAENQLQRDYSKFFTPTTTNLEKRTIMAKSDNAPQNLKKASKLPKKGLLKKEIQTYKKDTAIHFASSDINPFALPWQEIQKPNQGKNKHQVFGSATDISSKNPAVDVSMNRVIRCCSVDNGLSIENSLFHSHLSTFANNKRLSNTLSSVEGYKEQGSSEAECPTSSDNQIRLGRCNSYCSDTYGDGDNDSSQMSDDEVMVVCSSEQESLDTGYRDHSNLTCNQSTQTTTLEGMQKMRRRRKRSSTRIQKTCVGPESSRVPSTWASLHNMSLHLSQLIHNTSDLLGNIQYMGAKDTDHSAEDKVMQMPSGRYSNRDSSTQTAVDVAIQTDVNSISVNGEDDNKAPLMEGKSRHHEVNVIVRVIGSDVLGVSQEKESITLNKKASEKIQSMPDLHIGSSVDKSYLIAEAVSSKFRTSSPSLDMISQNQTHLNTDVSSVFPADYTPEQVSSSLGTASINSRPKSQTSKKHNNLNCSSKEVCFTDRASSPILTVEAGLGAQIVKSKSTQCLVNYPKTEFQEPVEELRKSLSPGALRLVEQEQPKFPSVKTKRSQKRSECTGQSGKPCDLTSFISVSSISLENVSDFSNLHSFGNPFSKESKEYSENNVPCRDNDLRNYQKSYSCPRERITVQSCTSISSYPNESLLFDCTSEESTIRKLQRNYIRTNAPTQSSSLISWHPNESQLFYCRQEESVTRNSQEMYKPNSHNLGNYHRESNDGEECWNGSESFDISEGTIQLHEDDAMSVAPSECNTDILININPFVDSIQKEHCKVPEDLPMHNKFTNWSGVSCQSQSSESRSLEQFQSAMRVPAKQKTKKSHTGAAISESCKAEFKALSDDRLREIERLRQEREKVMAAVRLDLNPHQLTVELAEAKLHYGLGETDTLLKLLKSDSIEEPFVVSKKQELYERHRKSIEGLRQKREERLRTCRRARSLSPSKHSVSTGQSQKSPVTATELPSQQREYLQKLPQAVVTSTSTTPPSKQEGACPSEIELLLQDYGRAREEARMEIARARDRLRERAEQEKRRLQQQALSQFLKDDLRFRTRASNSTLCTGSSLSLSSGPTSGYNSSNTVLLKEANRLSQTLQVSDKTKDAVVISSVPPVPASQNVGSHRPWLSAQDVRVEHTDVRVELDPQLPPSSSPPGWKRTLSLSSAPSVSTYFQDIAASAVSSAISEIRSAADGDLQNLLVGRSSGGWRHQGTERGVQAFYKSSSSLGRYSFLGAAELERPLPSLWCMIRDHSKTHLYHHCVHTTWTRPLDSSTQLVYLLTDCSTCRLSQPRDFCCISAESKQEGEWVLALRSVNEESLPPPNANAVRGELLPSAWLLQPGYQGGREIIRVVYLLQVDLGTPALPQRLLSSVARKQAAVIAELDAFFSL
ncbi:stAR-related lipid transfer protein 9 isoform X2 [Scleropages formosus]|uniref:stAR-related lipid transfer protein 9 isoform X2 n=1 Tax=Scleropages formosus TaxID=113540 RepID=UPI0010FA746A|nr:stAR-related lipid transfer protein 9 isoform X2 [Scleropages formosus]